MLSENSENPILSAGPQKPETGSEDPGAFRALIRDVCEGSEDAAWELVERYGDAIHRAVRRALNRRLRPKFDSIDFVQLVWSSFFRNRAKLKQFNQPKEMAAFLAAMARNKVGMEVRRRLMTEKYNVNRERSLNEPALQVEAERVASHVSPEETAIARERWNQLLEGQPQHYRQIIRLRLEGRTYQDIADSLHLAESTVRRFLKKLFREMAA
ncbi:MAG TPA: sigma-70 family RNA polymerase sigma factor [Thermoguttaceae bacterium]|nr:sigma-70 family RNA polymerase sigma factor [Thermoguttaceae bacterium]